MTDQHFDLLTQPWIRVRGPDGVRELSVREVFTCAHDLDALAGELPTQDVAILRVLLAILHRSVAELPGYAKDVWRGLWEAPQLPMALIGGYLDGVADRFDLFDERAPFFQVAGLAANKTSGLLKLVADVPDGHPYFTTRADAELDSVSFAEAARWVVHCQAFDPSGIKTGVTGDPRVKGGKGYPIGTGWAGRCGLVVLEGRTLKETLLLNLVLGTRDGDAEPDLPVWERRPLGPGVERRHPEPLGPADIMTWPVRRLLLHRENGRVVDVLLGNGDPIHARNRQNVETMSAWRYSDNQSKQHGDTYMPRGHDPNRRLWRGLSGILIQSVQGGSVQNKARPLLPPTALVWLATLTPGIVDPAHPIRLRAIGMTYGTQDASIEAIYDDALSMRVAVTSDPVLQAVVRDAAETAELAVRQLGHLAQNLASAAGREGYGPRDRAHEDAFMLLDERFLRWVGRLGPASHPEEETASWQREVRSLLLPIGEELVNQAGQVAWMGRDVRGHYLDSALAWRWFRTGLIKVLPAALPPSLEHPKEQTA